jgi:hypothetical protein
MQINIEKRYVLIILGIMFLLAGGLVYAIGGSNPTVMGHSAGEIEGVCKSDGTGCEGVFQGGALFYFGNAGIIFKDGATASANVQYTTGSVCYIVAYGQTKIEDGIVKTRAWTTGCSGHGNCDSGWLDAQTATCSKNDGTVKGKSTATATKDGITVNGYTGTATGSWA